MKRVISVLMSVVMLLSFAMGMNLTVLADDGKTITSATLTPVKPYTVYEGNYAGYSEGTDDKGNPYREYFYLAEDFNVGDVVDITFSDGTSDTYTYYYGYINTHKWLQGWFNKNEDEINLYSHEFTIDTADGLGTAYASYGIMDSNYNNYDYDIKNVPVEVIENPVESFSFVAVKQYEVVKGTHGEYYDKENKTDWHYYGPEFKYGDKITVNYTKGTSEEYTYRKYEDDGGWNTWGFVNAENIVLNVESCDFSFDGIGKTTFDVKLTDYGRKTDVPVTIIENPVETFSLTPVEPYTVDEGDYVGGGMDIDPEGNPIYYNYYQVVFNEGDKITVNYTNGTSEDFIYKDKFEEFVNTENDLEVLEVYSKWFMFEGTGKTTFEVELTDYEKIQQVPVTIVKKSSGGSTDPTPTPGGGSTGGGGAAPAPAPTTNDSQKTEEQKPSTSTTTTTTTSTQTPATVKVSKTTAKKKGVVVTWKKVKNVTGYEIQLATDKKFKKNKKTVKVNKQNASKKTVKKLKSKKKYYVRVRSYKIVNGKKVYGSWSKIKTVKTK